MQSGPLNPENFSQSLREISQRRRQGYLEVNLGEVIAKVHFIQGRVIEVTVDGVDPLIEIVEILKTAGLIKIESQITASSYQELLSQINQQMSEESQLTDAILKLVIKHRILNKLYDLSKKSGGFFSFKAQMVDLDREFLPSISVGSLLLDIVSLEADAARFVSIFKPETKISRKDSPAANFSEEERALYDLVGRGTTFAKLNKLSILSKFHLQEGLLALSDQGILIVEQTAKSKANPASFHSTMLKVDDLMKSVESSIDSIFDSAPASEGTEAVGDLAPAEDQAVDVAADSDETEKKPKRKRRAEIDQDPAEEELPDAGPGLKGRLIYLSGRILHLSWVPHLLVALFLAIAFAAPFLIWPKALFDRF